MQNTEEITLNLPINNIESFAAPKFERPENVMRSGPTTPLSVNEKFETPGPVAVKLNGVMESGCESLIIIIVPAGMIALAESERPWAPQPKLQLS